MTKPLIERLARIIDPDFQDENGEYLASHYEKVATQRAYALERAARCLAEVVLERGPVCLDADPSSLAVNLHVVGEAEAEVVRVGDRLVVRCGPGAVSKRGDPA